MSKTIGVVSLKGGVGKTSAVVSLGDAFAELGKNVLLVDANLSAPNLGLHLNIVDPEATIHHVLGRKSNLRKAIQELSNFDVMPATIFNEMRVNPLKLKDKLKYLKKRYDIILLDSAPNMTEENMAVLNASDELLVVTTPDHPTLSNTMKTIQSAMKKGIKINGLILNKVHNKNFELSLKDIEDTLDVPVMAVIPYDVNVLKALSEFIPFTSYKPRSRGSDEYRKLAATLTGEKYKPVRLRRLFRWINPEKQEVNRLVFYERVFKDQ